MPDYEMMYHLMVNASEDALAALEAGNVWDARKILIDAELKAETIYIDSAGTDACTHHTDVLR